MTSSIIRTVLLASAGVAVAAVAQDSAVPPPATAPVVTTATDPNATTVAVNPVVDAKAAKAAAKAEAKRKKELVAKYGMGPYPEEIDAYLAGKPDGLQPLYRNLYTGGERNAVLNFQRLGLAAMEAGKYKEAEWAFDRALERIEAVYANNDQANRARSLFHNEANKDYKGEPYERAMAYYYRGLLYLRAGDYSNARASFKGAELQDTMSDSETFQSDFAIMNYLIGWTQRCEGQGSTAKESFDIATKAAPALNAPPEGDNILFVTELGNGPVKARDGTQAQKLLFQAGAEYPESAATIDFTSGTATSQYKLVQASSVYYQATTRGGRAIDGLMDGKANWKEGTGAVGDALMNQGLSNLGTDSGMGMAAAGLIFSMFSSAMKTKADARAWDGLPDLILVGTGKATTPEWSYKVSYTKGTEAVQTTGPAMRADGKACSVVWTRSRQPTWGADLAGEDAGVAAALGRKKPIQEKNRLFRASLTQ